MGKRRGNGEGTISKRPSGTWFGQVSYFDPATGKQKRKTVSGRTKAEVVNKMQEARTLKASGRLTEQCKLTLSEWLDTWLEDYKKPQIKLSTYDSYYRLINSHLKPKLGGLKLIKLTTNEIQKFYIERLKNGRKNPIITSAEDGSTAVNKGLSTRTVKYLHTVLQEALDQAVKENLINSNPAHNTTQPRQVTKEIQPLSTNQVQDFLAAIQNDYLYPLYLTELGTGLRRGELLGLKWEDINMDKATAIIRRSLLDIKGRPYLQEDVKTKKSKRTVAFPDEVAKEMKKLKVRQAEDKLAQGRAYNDQGFVFCWPDGRPIPPNYCYHHFKDLIKKASLPSVRFHDLRHSFATILLEQGEDINTISKLLGHQSISITMDIYAHLTESMQSKAAIKMNAILTKRDRKSAAGE